MELKEALRVHQCLCACSSEIGTYILINDARSRRQTAHKKQQKYIIFRRIMPNDVLYSCFESILTFNAKKTLKKITNLTNTISLIILKKFKIDFFFLIQINAKCYENIIYYCFKLNILHCWCNILTLSVVDRGVSTLVRSNQR
jgi:hypothetical protein